MTEPTDPTLLDSEIKCILGHCFCYASDEPCWYRENYQKLKYNGKGLYGDDIERELQPLQEKALKALIATETAKARLDELGSVQLDYGKQQAHVWVNGKLVHIDTRLSELQEMLNG